MYYWVFNKLSREFTRYSKSYPEGNFLDNTAGDPLRMYSILLQNFKTTKLPMSIVDREKNHIQYDGTL